MNFMYKEQRYTLPNSLREIQLQQWQDYSRIYGLDLDQRALAIEILEDYEQETERTILEWDRLYTLFSFFSGIPLEEARAGIEFSDVYAYSTVFQQILKREEAQLGDTGPFTWQGKVWDIVPPPADEEQINANQFFGLMDLLRFIQELGTGDWSPMHRIAAAYLRTAEDPDQVPDYSEGSERSDLMKQLPLDIAFTLALYLGETLQIYGQLAEGAAMQQKEVTDGSED